MEDQKILVHAWELAGHGKAPFNVVGLWSFPSPSLGEANPSAYSEAMRSMPQGFGCGSCGVCGMPLTNNYLIKSADGRQFSVGSECVKKAGDKKLVDVVKKMEADRVRAAKLDKKRMLREAREEREREANGGYTDWEWEQAHREWAVIRRDREYKARCAVAAARYEPVASVLAGCGEWASNLAQDMRNGRGPSGRGVDICCDIYAKTFGRKNSAAYGAAYGVAYDILCSEN